MTNLYPFSLALFLSIQTLFLISQAQVPASNTFKYVNEGELLPYITEYGADYRCIPVSRSPFQLCFYNTTNNAFTLALRMGTQRSEALRRWVWEANRGKPVRENATFSLGKDGNLVLADYDGRVVWQTGTANKGVVGLELLPTGNMVLYDKNRKFVWQSFDYPTDTLLVGQSLKAGVTTKLISRASTVSNTNGPYSLELEPTRVAMYYKSASSPKPLLYFSTSEWFTIKKGSGIIENVTFTCTENDDGTNGSLLTMSYGTSPNDLGVGHAYLAWPDYNSTLSFLRLDINGNLRFYTYNDPRDWGAWKITYTMFADEPETLQGAGESVTKCQLPGRCDKFGLCSKGMCVACPLPRGLFGWSESCEPIKVPSCKPSDFKYYKVEGVEHFTMRYTKGNGPVKVEACESKCTTDCKCMGYFYRKDTSTCWTASDLKTLSKAANTSSVAYIKTPITAV